MSDASLKLVKEDKNGTSLLLISIALLIVSALSVTISAFLFQSRQNWQDITYLVASIAVMLICILAIVLVLVKKNTDALRLILFAVGATFLIRIFSQAGFGLHYGVALMAFVAIISLLALPQQKIGVGIFFGLLGGIFLNLLDIFLSTNGRSGQFYDLSGYIIIFDTLLILIFISIFILKINSFGLAVKAVLGFTLMALLPAVIIGALSNSITQNALTSNADQTLLRSAEQAALVVDTFIMNNLDTIRTDAQSPALQDFASASPVEASSDLLLNRSAIATLQALGLRDMVYVESYALLNKYGLNLIDTDNEAIGSSEANFDYLTVPLQTGLPFSSQVFVDADGKSHIVFSSPVRNREGKVVGVLRVMYSASILQKIISQQNGLAGDTSYPILLDDKYIVLADGYSPERILKTLAPVSQDILDTLISTGRIPPCESDQCSNSYRELVNQLDKGNTNFDFSVIGYQEINNLSAAVVNLSTHPWKVVFTQDTEILQAPIHRQTQTITLIASAITLLAAAIALIISRLLITPIQDLISTSDRISKGELNLQATIKTRDEIGTLANTFNLMTNRLRDTIETLETRVIDRTKNIERRAILLQTAADVGRIASRTRDLASLLDETAELISTRFGFYHVGIFLQDERDEFVILKAANSVGGKQMLERGHRLQIGQTGIVGYAVAHKQARIALDVGDDAIFFDNPDLPDTRSEMALPLISGDVVFGAIDVQSSETNAFRQEDIATLQIMADQVAISIENARLLEGSRAAVDATRQAYSDYEKEGWHRFIQERSELGYYVTKSGKMTACPSPDDLDFNKSVETGAMVRGNGLGIIYLPIKIRGNVIGAIRLEKSIKENWTPTETAFINEVSEQLGLTLESARLFEETKNRAEREKMVSEISSKIRATTDPQVMLDAAIKSLKQVLGEVDIQIKPISHP